MNERSIADTVHTFSDRGGGAAMLYSISSILMRSSMICWGSFPLSTACLTAIRCFLFFLSSFFLASFLAWSVGFMNFPPLVEVRDRRPMSRLNLMRTSKRFKLANPRLFTNDVPLSQLFNAAARTNFGEFDRLQNFPECRRGLPPREVPLSCCAESDTVSPILRCFHRHASSRVPSFGRSQFVWWLVRRLHRGASFEITRRPATPLRLIWRSE